jgi:hypothetical protein
MIVKTVADKNPAGMAAEVDTGVETDGFSLK